MDFSGDMLVSRRVQIHIPVCCIDNLQKWSPIIQSQIQLWSQKQKVKTYILHNFPPPPNMRLSVQGTSGGKGSGQMVGIQRKP